ncbi:Bug family tripartite tricarboxylate transporter substrate binding protein [Polynucleobacter sinensis]|uniref:Bug family tripartite tricarboxylate transporter substrate binding protein n=1 Tax=Polynucleobacter sinensis TaxID=1743157 RepID=UPI000AACC3DF|nr:tripartite tricarboxylate transporter substrate binding protein [Polynucleobacter sinensis]
MISFIGASIYGYAQESYPSRPITLIVPSSAGGTTDFTARLMSEPLTKALGQPVIVDNKGGASGNIGGQAVAVAKPDGYTLLVAYSGYQVGNPHLFKNLPWDPIKDFAPVAFLTRAPQVVVASPNLPVNDLKELVAYAKANPGKLNYASSGSGSIQHISAELLKQVTGIKMAHIPYKGAGPAVQDLMAGQVDLFITTPASVIGQIKGGKLKALAVTSQKRLTSLPNVATASEQGVKDFNIDSWFALYAPIGTSPEIVKKLNSEVNKILARPDIKNKAEDSGTFVEQMTPAQLAAFTKKEYEYWGKVIKSASISAE